MKVLIKLATVICAVGSFSPVPALALNAISSGSVSNNYLFIENAIDSEYFITPSALDPRFSLSLDQILIPCAIRSLAARKPSSLLCRASQPSQRAPQLAIPVRLLSIKPPSLAIAM
ncbi:hypothetical protein STW0522CIT27_08770 [Citrobacter portucalensis]|nr:hypothetical protein STW0522CIT27_08770 [Citrobacter portucalensis]